MNVIVKSALECWGLSGADHSLIAARENAVYKVTTPNGPVALRLHRQGYRTDAELWSELAWMEALADGGISVPSPIASISGEMLCQIDGVQVDVLTWLSGSTLESVIATLALTDRASLLFKLGKEMAKLHNVSDAWKPPEGFIRCIWDRNGFLGDAPVWGKFWDDLALQPNDRQLFLELRNKATRDLTLLENDLDYGLIHADLVTANVMVANDVLHLIDFDDGGFGFRIFDVATTLLKFREDSDFQSLKKNLTEGYRSIRSLDFVALDLFMALRAATYVGWNIARIEEDGARDRIARIMRNARNLAESYVSR
jgi:Ser/Thr protein kinase RdoA (MazF antagonist)